MQSQLNIPAPRSFEDHQLQIDQPSSGAGQTMAGKLQIILVGQQGFKVGFVPLPREGALTVLGRRS
jgi:hypothetical protein